MANDVEKRWNDPPMLRRAGRYVVIVLAVAGLAGVAAAIWAAARPRCLDAESTLCDTTSRLVVGLIPSGILLAGGIGALVIAYRIWRSGRAWPIWQGAAWFLLTLMVIYLSIAGTVG